MNRDFGIVHLTDLHYPRKHQAAWHQPLLHALKELGEGGTLIRGLAVTGDLVNSPRRGAFRRAANFIMDAGNALGLMEGMTEWGERIWVIDGNHDYRFGGLFRRWFSSGIETGGYLKRHSEWHDPQSDVLIIGLNSCESGGLARGYVAQDDLQRLRGIVRNNGNGKVGFRIALVHHHIVPLPSVPQELQGPVGRMQAKIFDEGFKLLENASLVARYLIDADFDLVLHGHEHQAFGAVLSHLEGRSSHPMVVLGGIEAARGFQVIRFRQDGGLDIERHVLEYGIPHARPHRVPVWRAEELRRLEWERESRRVGRYEKLELHKTLDQFGDLTQHHTVTNIQGPEQGDIKSIPFSVRAMQKLGTCVLDSIRDRETSKLRERNELEPPGEEIIEYIRLVPPPQIDQIHKGFEARSRVLNSFAMTTREAKFRNQPDFETTNIRALHPTRHLRLYLRFPSGGYAPKESPEVSAHGPPNDQKPPEVWPIDQSETDRVRPHLFYDAALGIALLTLEWVLPRFCYVLKWKLPDPPPSKQSGEAILAAEQVRALLELGGRDRGRLDLRMHELRNVICRTHLGWREDRPVTVNLALLALGEDLPSRGRPGMRMVCGTDPHNSPYRDIVLPWGAGVAGLAMRRRLPEFVDTSDPQFAGIYWPVEGLQPELHLLCVPIPLPWASEQRKELLQDPSVPCIVAVLSCADVSGNMERLARGGVNSFGLSGTVSSQLTDGILNILGQHDTV